MFEEGGKREIKQNRIQAKALLPLHAQTFAFWVALRKESPVALASRTQYAERGREMPRKFSRLFLAESVERGRDKIAHAESRHFQTALPAVPESYARDRTLHPNPPEIGVRKVPNSGVLSAPVQK